MKTIDIIVTSYREDLFDVVRPVLSNKVMPSWWANLSNAGQVNSDLSTVKNMKGCKGFIDLYKHSITFPLWTDVNFEIGAKGHDVFNWKSADSNLIVDWHSDEQKGGFMPGNEVCNVRIPAPWKFRCKQPLNVLHTNSSWSMKDPFSFFVPNGIIDVNKIHDLNFMFMVKRAEEKKLLQFQVGDAVSQYVPLTNKKINLVYELVTPEKFSYYSMPRLAFNNAYSKIEKLKKFFIT